MGDIVIVGGGFAGLEAARLFAKNRKKLGNRRVIVVDAKPTFDFLPILPDVSAGFIPRKHAITDLSDYLEKLKVNFECQEAVRINAEAGEVHLKNGGVLAFEYLILACGSVTNFYGQEEIQRRALKLDSAEDALVLLNTVTTYPSKKILIVGGGYTGIELATSLAAFLRRKRIKKYSINVIEKGEDILGPMPEWMKDYCRVNLCALRVNIVTEASVKEITDSRVKLSNGLEFEDYLLVWAAGVQTPSLAREVKADKDGQGRLVVDPYLRFSPVCFAAGDAAAFRHKGKTLRMAVQFSIAEGNVAARNILRLLAGKKKLLAYGPKDLGLLLPMASKKAIGKILFLRVRGLLAWFFHYVMCSYRSLSAENKFGILGDFVKRLFL